MQNASDLGIYSEVPFLDKVQRALTQVLMLLFANGVALLVWDVAFVAFMSVIVSREVRLNSSSRGFRVTLLTVLLVAFAAWGWALGRYLFSRMERVAFGSTVFGELGGLPSRTFFTALKCACAIEYEFLPDDQEAAKEFCGLDREVLHQTLRLRYEAINRDRPAGSNPPPDFEQVWNGIILKLRAKVGPSQFVTYGDLLESGNIGMTVEATRLIAVTSLVAPIIKIMQIIMVYLLARLLDGQTSLLTVIQVALFLNLLLSLILFNYHAHQNAEFPLAFLSLPGLSVELQNQIKAFTGRVLRPMKITMKKGFLSLIEGYFSSLVMLGAFVNTLSTFLLVGIALGITYLWHPSTLRMILPWYKHFSLGLVLVAGGLIVTYHMVFLILRNFTLLLAPVVAGVIVVVVPYACIYLAGGHVDLTLAKNNILAVIMGSGAVLGTAIASGVKKAMGADGDDEKGSASQKD